MGSALLPRGSFLWLLALEAKLAWRSWWSAGKMGPWARIGLFSLLGVIGVGAGYGVASLLGAFGAEPKPDPLSILIVSMILALVATLMLSQALLAATELIYTRRDLDLLFSSPITPWTVMLSRAFSIAMNVGALYVIMVIAVLIWTPVTGAVGWWVVLPAVLAVTLLITALGLVVAKALLAWIGPQNTRVTAQILAAIIGASIFLASQSTNFMPRAERQAYWERLANDIITTRIDMANPIWLPARAVLGDAMALAILFGVGLTSFLLAAWWFSRGFVADAAAAAGMGAKRRAMPSRTPRFRGGVISGVIRKEWRLLRRDPLLLSQVGLQIVYLLPMLFLVWTAAGRGGDEAALMNALLGGAFVLLAATLGGSLSWITASAEDAPDLIAASPVKRERIELGKLAAAAGPVALVMLIPAGAIAINSWQNALIVWGCAVGAAATAAQIGIWHQAPANRKEFRKQRSSSWTAAFGQGFVAMSWSSAAGLAMADLAIVSIIPVLIAIGLTLALQDSRPKPKD